ncbi:Kinesin-like protein Klp59C [Symbiodinium microadriaticum]|uniref:Kinesin-like protein Klp59C n=1 Tax=Symbiodinium microadriaticum TaxID=2951 RepID=A0A1Q9D1W3_SYMMI|nr:Kinesin-like protein Klp59C [Symbiodinium microadriaticum]
MRWSSTVDYNSCLTAFVSGTVSPMGNEQSGPLVRNADKRTSRREHRAIFEVRKRPIFPHEIEQGEFDAITCLDPGRIVVHDARMHPDMVKLYMNHHDFDYDEAFDEAADNRTVYEGTAKARAASKYFSTKAIVEAALEGQNGTVMMCSIYQQAAEDIFAGAAGRTVTESRCVETQTTLCTWKPTAPKNNMLDPQKPWFAQFLDKSFELLRRQLLDVYSESSKTGGTLFPISDAPARWDPASSLQQRLEQEMDDSDQMEQVSSGGSDDKGCSLGLTRYTEDDTNDILVEKSWEMPLGLPMPLDGSDGTNMTDLARTIAEGRTRMTEELDRSRGKELTLVDNRGVAKPDHFNGEEVNYLQWNTKTENFIFSVLPELEEKALEWAAEQELRSAWRKSGLLSARELDAVLQRLLEEEPFSIIRNIATGTKIEEEPAEEPRQRLDTFEEVYDESSSYLETRIPEYLDIGQGESIKYQVVIVARTGKMMGRCTPGIRKAHGCTGKLTVNLRERLRGSKYKESWGKPKQRQIRDKARQLLRYYRINERHPQKLIMNLAYDEHSVDALLKEAKDRWGEIPEAGGSETEDEDAELQLFAQASTEREEATKQLASDVQDSAMASLSAAMNFEHGDGDDDYLPNGNESYATNHRHIQELQRLSAFQQVTTNVPPSYDGRSSWFAYEDAIDDWCDITELDGDKRGPALRNRLEGEAAIHKRLLDRDRLKDPNNGVKYVKSFLRPLFVKGAANVFLYRFQQFMNLHRGNGDMLRWITRFQLSVQRMQEAWNDTYLPITDPMNAEVRAFIAGLPAEEQGTITNDEAMERANDRLRDQHARTIPITANLVALIFVSLSDLTQDQRQVLTSLMAHRNRVLADYRLNELREVYLEIFCTTKTSVENPLLAPSGHGGRKTFLVIDEGYLDKQEGYWVEDEEDGAEGFLEADEDTFWVYDEDNYTWFQRRFQGRKIKRGFKGHRKGKSKGRKGSGGRRFFKNRKGRSNLADNNTEAWQAEGQWHDDSWQESSWDDWSWDYAEESYAAKGKGKEGKKGKGKGKYGKNDGKDGKGGSKDGAANLADSAQGSAAIAAATTFYTNHLDFYNLSFMATENHEAFMIITQPLTPTSMVLDLGCTRAMTSRVAAQDLMKFCDQNKDCGIWYNIAETQSKFTFANSESTQCKQKLVICMYDREFAIQSTEFDIVEQGHVPTLMSLPQMRNLRFQFDLQPDKAFLSSSVLGIENMQLKVAPSSHLVLDLIDLSEYMWHVRFGKFKKSSFLTYYMHYEYGFHQKLSGGSSFEEVPEEPEGLVFATDDEWVVDENKMELIRVHEKMRQVKYAPKEGQTPIPLEFLDVKRTTIMEFSKEKIVTQEDDWRSTERPTAKTPDYWRGKPEDSSRKSGTTGSFPSGKEPVRRRVRIKGSGPLGPVPKKAAPPPVPEDDPDLHEYAPSEPGEPLSEEARNELFPDRKDVRDVSSLEPRRIALPLPGHEVSRASPQYKRMLDKLNDEVELYKLHVKHYHMSPAQFRRTTSMLGLPGEIYDKYDKIFRTCRVCSTSVPTPPRARVAGLRASSFGDLIFVDHEEIKFGSKAYLAFVIIDGATNLLWATALTSLEAPETLNAFRQWNEENNCIPKGIVGDQAFFTDQFMSYYKFHGITPLFSVGDSHRTEPLWNFKGYDSEKIFDPRFAVLLSHCVPQQPTNDDDGDYPGYEDPRAEMPVDDEDMPPQSQQPEPDLDDGPIELGSGGHPPPAPPGGGTFVPVPEDDSEDLDMPYDPGNDEGGHPPGGGPLGPGPGFGPSPDEPPVQMEYHDEAPPPGGLLVRNVAPTRVRGAHPDDVSKAKEPPVPEADGDSDDTDATVDYREELRG